MNTKDELRWKLDDVLVIKDFDNVYKELEKELNKIDGWLEKLKPEMPKEIFKKIIDEDEIFSEKLSRLGYLPHLMESTDTKNPTAMKLKSRANDLELRYSQKIRPLSFWIMGKKIEGKKVLDDVNAKRLFASVPDLEYQFHYSRLAEKHTLSQKEEEIVENLNLSGLGTIEDLRGIIENEFHFEFQPKKNKKVKIIKTQGELMRFVHSDKKDEREAAYRALFLKQKEHIEKFFLIYQAAVKNWDYQSKIRGFASPISRRNFANHIPDRVIEVLLDVCSKNKDIFQRYFQFKAKTLGMKKISRFDIYAPLKGKNKKIEFNQAQKIVLENLAKFNQGFADKAEIIISQEHIDSHPRPNKRSGAFCATINPKITPYILLNYTNDIRNVYTLAHELGHGIHSLYANGHYGAVQQAPLPLAETASTLSEMILFEALFDEEEDMEIKRSMLSEKIGETYATVLRQNYFVIFEIQAHELINKGADVNELSNLWLETLKEQFGNSVQIDPIFKYEWSYIPHIIESPFYCYAYNFGELLSFALYARYKKEGKSFIPKIETILAAGGAKNPEKTLQNIGIEMDSADFWSGSFEILRNWQSKLETI